MGPSDSRNTVAGAVMPRLTTASATRLSNARSSSVNASASDFTEKACDSSARNLSHLPVADPLEKEAISVWKDSQNLLSSGIIWRGWGGVNEHGETSETGRTVDLVHLVNLLQPNRPNKQERPLVAPPARLVSPSGAATAPHPIQRESFVSCL